jgi:hypothetical protein
MKMAIVPRCPVCGYEFDRVGEAWRFNHWWGGRKAAACTKCSALLTWATLPWHRTLLVTLGTAASLLATPSAAEPWWLLGALAIAVTSLFNGLVAADDPKAK